MNRYTLEGMVSDAAHGKRVAYIGRRAGGWLADAAFVAEHEWPDRIARVYRAHGQQRIEFTTGGRLTFHATEAGVRGITADIAVLDEASSRNEQSLESARAAVMACVGGEVIRA